MTPTRGRGGIWQGSGDVSIGMVYQCLVLVLYRHYTPSSLPSTLVSSESPVLPYRGVHTRVCNDRAVARELLEDHRVAGGREGGYQLKCTNTSIGIGMGILCLIPLSSPLLPLVGVVRSIPSYTAVYSLDRGMYTGGAGAPRNPGDPRGLGA